MRTLSISWIILGHTYFYTDIIHYQHYRRLKQLYKVDDNPFIMWLSNFTFSVDTFFHIRWAIITIHDNNQGNKKGKEINVWPHIHWPIALLCCPPLHHLIIISNNSGVLLIYSSWKKMKLSEGKIDIIDFFVHRIWRWVVYLPLFFLFFS